MFPCYSIENKEQFTKEKTYNRCILPECNAMKITDLLSQSPDRQDAAAKEKSINQRSYCAQVRAFQRNQSFYLYKYFPRKPYRFSKDNLKESYA